MSEMRLSQVSVPLSAELRSWVEEQAQAEDRSIAAQIRHYVAVAARQATTDRARARVRDRDRGGVAA